MGTRVAAAAGVWLALAGPVVAHREDYLDETLVFQTIERGEFEPEYWFDLAAPSGRAYDTMRYHLALEYGLTEHWMLDARGTVLNGPGAAPRFAAGRLESRMRFREEGEWPVDVAFSCEANVERDAVGHAENGVEPRLILSRDLGRVNVTCNVAEEIPLDAGGADTNLALGFRHGTTERVRFGAELRYAIRSRDGAVFPQCRVVAWPGGTFKFGFSRGFDRNRESFSRIVMETEL